MPELAPIEYIRDYYEGSLKKAAEFPREYGFYQSFLSYVQGESVLHFEDRKLSFQFLNGSVSEITLDND